MISSRPLISVIIAVYNNEKFLPFAIRSVTDQKFDDYEIVIVDDGSTDNTPEIADSYARSDKKIRVIHQQNQWIYASFNNGIKAASGKYIYILNSDDRLERDALYRMALFVKKNPVDVLWTAVRLCVYDNKEKDIAFTDVYEGKVHSDRIIDNIEQVRQQWPKLYENGLVKNQANLYKRELAIRHPFRNDVFGADAFFNLSIANDVHSMGYLSGDIYYFVKYNIDGMNASDNKFYNYEHKMFNDWFWGYNKLFLEWNIPKKDYMQIISNRRLADLNYEFGSLKSNSCSLNTKEKIRYIFEVIYDDTVVLASTETNRSEEIQSRMLSFARELVINDRNYRDYDSLYEFMMLESLLHYEYDNNDVFKIKNGVYNKSNHNNLGEVFWNKIITES